MHALFYLLEAFDVQHGFLLTGEGGIREVFSGCRRTHRPAYVSAIFGFEIRIRLFQCGIQGRREWRLHDPITNLRTHLGKALHIIHIQFSKHRIDLVREAIMREKLPVCMGCRGKPARHFHRPFGSQVSQHFSEGRILAANAIDVAHLHFVQAKDIVAHRFPRLLFLNRNTFPDFWAMRLRRTWSRIHIALQNFVDLPIRRPPSTGTLRTWPLSTSGRHQIT